MTTAHRKVTLLGRVFITGQIELLTGLHIGAGRAALSIGGMENPVVRDPLTERPYIPGSSLKGKLRSLLEKQHALPQNQSIGQGVWVHVCYKEERDENGKARRVADPEAYFRCSVCPVFGTPAEFAVQASRLVARDVPLDNESAERLLKARTDLPFTEVKWEAAIDRVTSAASPRQMERVPNGAVFSPMELVFNIYEKEDSARLTNLLTGLQLLEDDYLGGLGSRGSGKVAFRRLRITARSHKDYGKEEELGQYGSGKELLAKAEGLLMQLQAKLSVS